MRAHYEEETLRFKEAQVRALEELEEKHQVMREEAQQEKEEEKKLLMTVSPAVFLIYFQGYQTLSVIQKSKK